MHATFPRHLTQHRLLGIFKDEIAIDIVIKEGYRITLIGKDVEALMNRAMNPMSKLCRYSEELTLVYAVTKPIDGWLDDADAIRQMKNRSFEPLLYDNLQDLKSTQAIFRPINTVFLSFIHMKFSCGTDHSSVRR